MSNGFRNAVKVEGVLEVRIANHKGGQKVEPELVWNNEQVNIREKDDGFRIGCTLVTWDAWNLLKRRVRVLEVDVED